jgi:dipeptidase E
MKLLLLSNSTNAGETYLEYALESIQHFLGDKPVKALFIPYAAVTFSFDEYTAKVKQKFNEINHDISGIHAFKNPIEAVENAECIVVGGGNTFHLLKKMQEYRLTGPIRARILAGIPYIGWSAGSNLTCPTICTTNDMPIVEPESFKALDLVPFQINPHYLDANPDGHAGETREMRIEEYLAANPGKYVVGLREGTMLYQQEHSIHLMGKRKVRVFKEGMEPLELGTKDNLDFILG